MSTRFPAAILRPGIAASRAFTVSDLPCRAKLDQNESPFDLPDELKREIAEELIGLRWSRYPQPVDYTAIKAEFARAIGQPVERVVITAGCDQMILLAYWAAGGPGRRARYFEPTYPMFGHYAVITGTPHDAVVLGPDFDVAAHGLGEPVDVLLLVSPNNPTGGGPDPALIESALGEHGLVFVDEAYADFDPGGSVLPLIDANPNLLIGRSLSKALLAGVRLGYGIGHPELIRALERLLFAPYHLSALQLLVARRFGSILPALGERVDTIVDQREQLLAGIADLGLTTWPSRGNFVMFAVDDAPTTCAGLAERGIRVRDVSGLPGLDRHLRVTVGMPRQNRLFLDALADLSAVDNAKRWP